MSNKKDNTEGYFDDIIGHLVYVEFNYNRGPPLEQRCWKWVRRCIQLWRRYRWKGKWVASRNWCRFHSKATFHFKLLENFLEVQVQNTVWALGLQPLPFFFGLFIPMFFWVRFANHTNSKAEMVGRSRIDMCGSGKKLVVLKWKPGLLVLFGGVLPKIKPLNLSNSTKTITMSIKTW